MGVLFDDVAADDLPYSSRWMNDALSRRKRKAMRCSDMCGFLHPMCARTPINVPCNKPPKGLLIGATVCRIIRGDVLEFLYRYIPELVIGHCIDACTGEALSDYFTFHCAQWHSVYDRGGPQSEYRVCPTCGYPYLWGEEGYYLARDFADRDVRIAGAALCCVESFGRDLTRRFGFQFVEYELRQYPIDGRCLMGDRGYVPPESSIQHMTPLPREPISLFPF